MEEKFELTPELSEEFRKLSQKAFGKMLPEKDMKKLLSFVPDENVMKSDICTTNARGSIGTFLFWGTIECIASDLKKRFYATHWGLGFGGYGAWGCLMADNWNDLFKHGTIFHSQTIGVGGGLLQITWFDEHGAPVGQFNGGGPGLGIIEVGGSGSWKDL